MKKHSWMTSWAYNSNQLLSSSYLFDFTAGLATVLTDYNRRLNELKTATNVWSPFEMTDNNILQEKIKRQVSERNMWQLRLVFLKKVGKVNIPFYNVIDFHFNTCVFKIFNFYNCVL